jgi:hypothetical protein
MNLLPSENNPGSCRQTTQSVHTFVTNFAERTCRASRARPPRRGVLDRRLADAHHAQHTPHEPHVPSIDVVETYPRSRRLLVGNKTTTDAAVGRPQSIDLAGQERPVKALHGLQTFWMLIDELAPTLPVGGDITWTVSLETLMRWLRAHDLSLPEERVELTLASASDWNPGWPWTVEKHGCCFVFKPRFW